jgi:hypothetical protein
MRLVPTPLGFNYRMEYVPKGARNPRLELFRGADTAVVRHIDAGEADPAFRISRPELDIWPLVQPRTPRSNPWGFIRNAVTFEILYYEGCIWWPYMSETWQVTSTHIDAEECLRMIEKDKDFFDAPRLNGSYDVATKLPQIRKSISDDRDEKLAQAQRKTYENILICDGKAYTRGGMPIYFRNYHGNKKVWETDIASVGPDRRGDPKSGGLYAPPGSYCHRHTETALCRGHFWLADDAQSAIHAAHRRQTAFPTIDVLMPELIENVGQRIRLDSLFREVVRMFSDPFCDHWRSGCFRPFKNAFDALCERLVDDCLLSRQRLDLLRAFVPQLASIDHWEMNRIREDFTSFDALERFNPTWPDEMTAEDLDALISLAS